MLSIGQTRHPNCRQLEKFCNPCGLLKRLESSPNTCQQLFASNRFFDKVDSPCLHRSNGHRDVGMSTHDNRGSGISHIAKTLDQVDAAHPRQKCVDEKTARIVRTVRVQEALSAREDLDGIAIVLENITQGRADRLVVVDHEDSAKPSRSVAFGIALASEGMRTRESRQVRLTQADIAEALI
jgi:hypothetical protein